MQMIAHDDDTRCTLYHDGDALVTVRDGATTNTYFHRRDYIGADLGVGDGIRSGREMIARHGPKVAAQLVSSHRGDLFAIGYFDAVRDAYVANGAR